MKILPNGIAVIEGDEYASKWIEEQNDLIYDQAVRKTLMPLLNPGDVAVDAGALLGSYAKGFCEICGPTGEVWAFEPNPEAWECLKHNVPECHAMPFGLSDTDESLEMRNDRPDNTGCTYFKGYGPYRFMTLDSMEFKKLDLFKIDVEGMEPKVLWGARQTIERLRPLIFIEINHPILEKHHFTVTDILDPLRTLGYTPRFIGEGHTFDKETHPQIDVLMVP